MIRCQIVLPGRTGIPEDQFVNTIYVSNNGPYDGPEHATQLAGVLGTAYATSGGSEGMTLSNYMSPFIDRTQCTVRVYDMAAPSPRPPSIAGFQLSSPFANVAALPEEVALCLSIYGANPRTPRRRGRLYLGPFNGGTLDVQSGSVSPSRPKTDVLQVIRDWGNALEDGLAAAGHQWFIKSEVPSTNYVQVVGGYCDDAWDTQRRRGVDPQSRWTWPASA